MLKSCAGLAALMFAVAAAAQSCPTIEGARRLESGRYILSYRTQPAKLAVGQHFTVEMAICAKDGQPAAESVRVDGFMPEHNHGMNYRAAIKPAAGGRYLADGLMFHMPGKWDFIFEIRGAGRTDRVTHSIMLQ